MDTCKCFFCLNNKEHKHTIPVRWISVTGKLLVAESLDPNDIVPMEACYICGHRQEVSRNV